MDINGYKIVSLTSVLGHHGVFFLKAVACGGYILAIKGDIGVVSGIMIDVRKFGSNSPMVIEEINNFFSEENLIDPNDIKGVDAWTLSV